MALLRAALVACAVAGLALAPGRARAQSGPGWSPSVLVRGGTLGFGPELDVRVPSTRFGLRADVDGLGLSGRDWIAGRAVHGERAYAYDMTMKYGGPVRLLNGGVSGDWYPFGGRLRLSVGLVVNGDRADLHAQPWGALRLGGTTVVGPAAGRVDARASFNAVAPVVGLGYSALVFGRVRVSLDVGAMVEGNPHLSVRASGPFTALPSVAGDVERGRARLQRAVNCPVYPVAMLGVGWQF